MSKKLLTSIAAIVFAMPALADNPTTSGTFPTGENGYMQENYIYTNAATSTNMDGVYEGTVNATAYYDQCPANSYCDGTSQTPVACSTVGGGSYTLSDAESDSASDCYRACASGDVAHSLTVSGRFYSDGTNKCEAATCDNGYHVTAGLNATQISAITTSIGNTEGAYYGRIDNSGRFYEGDYDSMRSNQGQGHYGISDKNSFAVEYGSNKGMIKGHGRCSTHAGTDPYSSNSYTTVDTLTDETGQNGAQYCYCQLDSYTPVNGTPQSLSGPWVFIEDIYGADFCASGCADECAFFLRLDDGKLASAIRAAVFGSLQPTLASCDANTITINWNGTTTAAIEANGAGAATYGSDVRTPQSATPVPGKTFKGWRFSAPTNP